MIIEHYSNRHLRGIVGINLFEEVDELAAAMSVDDLPVNVTAYEIQAGHQCHRPMADYS